MITINWLPDSFSPFAVFNPSISAKWECPCGAWSTQKEDTCPFCGAVA
jgi:hypothetical protein